MVVLYVWLWSSSSIKKRMRIKRPIFQSTLPWPSASSFIRMACKEKNNTAGLENTSDIIINKWQLIFSSPKWEANSLLRLNGNGCSEAYSLIYIYIHFNSFYHCYYYYYWKRGRIVKMISFWPCNPGSNPKRFVYIKRMICSLRKELQFSKFKMRTFTFCCTNYSEWRKI